MLRSSAGGRTPFVAYIAERAASRGTRNVPPAQPVQQQVVELSLSQVEISVTSEQHTNTHRISPSEYIVDPSKPGAVLYTKGE